MASEILIVWVVADRVMYEADSPMGYFLNEADANTCAEWLRARDHASNVALVNRTELGITCDPEQLAKTFVVYSLVVCESFVAWLTAQQPTTAQEDEHA